MQSGEKPRQRRTAAAVQMRAQQLRQEQTEIVQDLQAALAQFAAIADDLGVEQELNGSLAL